MATRTTSPRLLRSLLAAAAACAAMALAPAAARAEPVKLIQNATSRFDSQLTGSNGAQRSWMRDTYWRMRGYSPYFENVGSLTWAPPSDFYKDLYALYPSVGEEQEVINLHPDWLLRDARGRPLYIPYSCSGGTCPAYAADPGNSGFRAWWIASAGHVLDAGYAGIFIDNVNMDLGSGVGDGSGAPVRPIDPRTGAAMTDAAWRSYVASFTEQIKAAFPDKKIAHNTGQWWTPHSDPGFTREAEAADIVEIERGFNDGGLAAGGGTFGFETYLAHVDWLHARGASIIAEPYNLTLAKAEFELAGYFLVRAGDDAIASDWRSDPDNWWTGWATDLGAASGSRFEWKGLIRRDYERGFVLVNQPGAARRTVALDGPYERVSGGQVTEVSLDGGRGAVLKGDMNREPTSTSLQVPANDPTPVASGSVEGASDGKVVVSVYHRDHKKWSKAKTRAVRVAAGGRYRLRVGKLGDGVYRARALYKGSTDARASVSKRRRFRIR